MEQDFKSFQRITRLAKEYMYISEKIDGTNAQLLIQEFPLIEDNNILTSVKEVRAGSRNRWLTPEDDNFGFAAWVQDNKEELIKLPVGRYYGEWWGKGIQSGYGLSNKKLSLFNQSLRGIEQKIKCIDFVPVLYEGNFCLDSIAVTMEQLKAGGSKAAPGFMRPEGVVVYLKHSQIMFKQTFDDNHKGERQ